MRNVSFEQPTSTDIELREKMGDVLLAISSATAKVAMRVIGRKPKGVENAIEKYARGFLKAYTIATSDDEEANARAIYSAIADYEPINIDYKGSPIRQADIVIRVFNEVMRKLQMNQEINNLTVGTVDLPDFAMDLERDAVAGAIGEWVKILYEFGTNYDIPSRGPFYIRKLLINYILEEYQQHLSPELKADFAQNSAIAAGGMQDLSFIFEAHVQNNINDGGEVCFIMPDSSFGTASSFVNGLIKGRTAVKRFDIETKPENLLNLSKEDVEDYYQKNPIDTSDKRKNLWYITPVANPPGTVMKAEQLREVCETIVEKDPHAVIVMDAVYVRTLKDEDREKLMSVLFKNKKVLNRIIFVDSFSKSHGACSDRVATYFSANKNLFDSYHSINTQRSAGAPRAIYAEAAAFAKCGKKHRETLRKLHEFWQAERKGLYEYLMQFEDLFEKDQIHLSQKNFYDLDNSCGLYICLRLKAGVTEENVTIKTRCKGVLQNMAGGQYMRFAVGAIREPKFSKKERFLQAA